MAYYNAIGEVASHTNTHTTGHAATYEYWDDELTQCRNKIESRGNITSADFISSRAPFLEFSDNYFQNLVDKGFKIDSSCRHLV